MTEGIWFSEILRGSMYDPYIPQPLDELEWTFIPFEDDDA